MRRSAEHLKCYFNDEHICIGTIDDFYGDYFANEYYRLPFTIAPIGKSSKDLSFIEHEFNMERMAFDLKGEERKEAIGKNVDLFMIDVEFRTMAEAREFYTNEAVKECQQSAVVVAREFNAAIKVFEREQEEKDIMANEEHMAWQEAQIRVNYPNIL
jgi:hypothetical protein